MVLYDLYSLLPEGVLLLTASSLLVVGVVYDPNGGVGPAIHRLSTLLLFLLLLLLFRMEGGWSFKTLLLLSTVLYLLLVRVDRFEFPILILFALLGQLLLIGSQTLLILYLAVELTSFVLYTLASYDRESLFSTESGLKYFVMGAFSSSLMLYGISVI
jgi:NADH-quinone oxidoreductase subunit N